VPNAGNSKAWDRYAYTTNNPLRYIDPTGHCSGNASNPDNPDAACWSQLTEIENKYTNVDIDPAKWTTSELEDVEDGLDALSYVFGGAEQFSSVVGDISLARRGKTFTDYIDFLWGDPADTAAYTDITNGAVTFYDYSFDQDYELQINLFHEVGHVFSVNNPEAYSEYISEFWECKNFSCQMKEKEFGLPASPYGGTSPLEDFAESFAIAIWMRNEKYTTSLLPKGAPFLPDNDRWENINNILDRYGNKE